ncbi:MAG: VWA domain-containing protein, partial [Candidatus Korobacteraceae bacterium]
LILFAGFAIDAGILYVTKAKLGTAVDGAVLTGMKNLGSNTPAAQATAATLAADMFAANYGANAPTPTITFPVDSYGEQQVQVAATVNVNTYFMRYLSNWAAVPVADTGVATRGKLIMSIVLDRSGSMTSDGGATALVSAVPLFVDKFDNTLDKVALLSFSSNARIDFPIGTGFQTPIGGPEGAVATMVFTGGTFGTGAGTKAIGSSTTGAPMSMADAQNNSVTIIPGSNVIKVLVYFTDGLMNASQDSIYCLGKGGNPANLTLINYGGFDSGNDVDILDPSCSPASSGTGCTNETGHISVWTNCTSGCSSFQYDAAGDICKNSSGTNVTTFTPQDPALGTSATFTRTNVTAETQYRAIQTAAAMRTESPVPTYIFTIGLGPSVTSTTQAFLAQLANDPSYSTYIKGQPQGQFFWISSCPGATCTADLNTAFNDIAAKVLLRLTQ